MVARANGVRGASILEDRMDNRILIRPTECWEYLGIAQSSFYRYIKLGLLTPDGYGKRNQPMFHQETLNRFCQEHGVEPGQIQRQGKSTILEIVGRPKEDEIHHTGAIIHWSERYRDGSRHTHVPVTCTTCQTKFNKLEGGLLLGLNDGSFTGCCINCYRKVSRRSHLKGTGYISREGYVMRHRLTFTPEEWELIVPMYNNTGGYILEHRAIVALAIGRPLTR